MEIRAVIHFAVPAAPGAPGAPTSPMTGNVDKLPAVLKAGLQATAPRYVFACNPKLASSAQHVMSNLPGEVNCLRCRATQAWQDAPDVGPRPKVERPGDDGLGEYLDRPAPGPVQPPAAATPATPAAAAPEKANAVRQQDQAQAQVGKQG